MSVHFNSIYRDLVPMSQSHSSDICKVTILDSMSIVNLEDNFNYEDFNSTDKHIHVFL